VTDRALRALQHATRWLFAIVAWGCDPAPRPAPDIVATPIVSASPQAEVSGFGPSVGFRSVRQLDDHAARHAAEFGDVTATEYLRLAQALRDTVVGGPILEARRADGVITRFDRTSAAFLAFNRDGTIRTFFRPNDGERYFRRQARRSPDP
jgi:hypothetical protein